MITINLLPRRRESEQRQNRGTHLQAACGAGVLLVILGMCGVWAFALNQDYHTLLKERVAAERILANLKETSQRVELVATKHAALLARSRLLEQKNDQKFVPVILMDAISRSVNPLSLWLHRLVVSGQEVEIEGRGLNSDDIRTFVDTLEQTALWGNLLMIETRAESHQGSLLHHFSIKFTIDRSINQ